jgi:hypothetical protein
MINGCNKKTFLAKAEKIFLCAVAHTCIRPQIGIRMIS